MSLSRSEQLSDAQLTEALTVEPETYRLDEWNDFPAGVNIFHPKHRERNLKEIVTALEESSLGTYTRPWLNLSEDGAGNQVYFVKLYDYQTGYYTVAPLTLPLLPDDPRFEGWPGVLLVTRLLMDIIDSVPSTIPTPDKEGVASTLLP